MAFSCGLDFGTSNSTLALVRDGRSTPLILDAEATPPETTPTLLYFTDDFAQHYGSAAVREYVDRGMEGRFIQSIKRHLPSPHFDHTFINGRAYDLSELIAGFLEHLRFMANKAAGGEVDCVLMGRPAVFAPEPERDRLAERRLEQAAAMAGFTEVQFRIEPIAAARAFEQELDREVVCLVGDLGGGTSDFTVMRLGPERAGRLDRSEDILGSDGVNVGGNDFDAALVRLKVLPALGGGARYRPIGRWVTVPTRLHVGMTRWHALSFLNTQKNREELDRWIFTADDADGLRRLKEVIEWNYGFSLFRAVERAKVELSRQESTRLQFSEGQVDIDAPVTRAELDAACEPLIAELEGCVDGLMERLEMSPGDIDAVFLTGGTSLIPRVRRIFRERFGDRLLDRDAFTSVGAGLGVEAAERFADR